MKKLKIIFTAAAALLAFAFPASAQKGTMQMSLNYNYGIPTGAFSSDLVSDGSPRGGRGSILYSFTDKLAGGLELGYQDYYQKYPRGLYHMSSQDVSAVISNSIQTSPVILKAKYSLLSSGGIKPYVSLGAGANLINFRQYFGQFGSSQSNVGFLAQGGLGVIIPFRKNSSSGINVGAAYDYAPYTKNGYNNLNTFNLQAGVVFPIR